MARLTSHSRTASRRLRKTLTDTEQLLWNALRKQQIAGHKFRRQHPVGKHIVDFVCMEKRLAIEVDGGQHASQVNEDIQRSRDIEAEGYRVLRFWNNEVLQNLEGVKETIWRALTGPKPPPP